MSERWGVALVASMFLVFGVALSVTAELARVAIERLHGGDAGVWLIIPRVMATFQIAFSGLVLLKAVFNDIGEKDPRA